MIAKKPIHSHNRGPNQMQAAFIHWLSSSKGVQEEVPGWSGIQGKIREERSWGDTRWELKKSVPNSAGADQNFISQKRFRCIVPKFRMQLNRSYKLFIQPLSILIVRNKNSLLFALILSTIIFIFFYKVLFQWTGYLSWHNFVPGPMQSYSYYYFWNPYFATGTPILTPLRSIVQGITSSFFISFLSIFIGYNSSVKLYIFATVFFMGISFYALTGEFGAHFISRSVSSSFFLLNPIMFTMIAYGDFPLFVAFGFYFIGLKFLIRFSRKGGDSYLLPLAILFLLFSNRL